MLNGNINDGNNTNSPFPVRPYITAEYNGPRLLLPLELKSLAKF